MDDATARLADYITNQLQIGQTADEIYGQLTSVGWPPNQVQQAFGVAQQRMTPQAMQSTANSNLPEATGQRRGRLKTGWTLLKISLQVLRGNQYLMRYFVMTWLWIIAFNIVWFSLSIFVFIHVLMDGSSDSNSTFNVVYYLAVFVAYLITYCIVNFYAAALAANVLDIFKGQRQPYGSYVAKARSRFVPILVYSLIASIIGMILQFIVERIRFVGWLLSFIFDAIWSLGTMFVLPILMDQEVSAPTAIKQSFQFFKQTWGENITAKVGVNTPLFLIQLAILTVLSFAFTFAIQAESIAAVIAVLIVYVVVSLSLAVLGSFANSLLNVALYYFAQYHQVPAGFSAELLNSVMVKGKRRRFLGKTTTA